MNDDATLQDDKLQEVARRLGARAAERLDVERTAQVVVARLRTEPRAEAAWLRIAAMLVIVVGGGVVALNVWTSPHTTPLPSASVGGELSELSGEELRVVLEALGQPGSEAQAVSAQDVGLEDLSAPQLRALLESLGG